MLNSPEFRILSPGLVPISGGFWACQKGGVPSVTLSLTSMLCNSYCVSGFWATRAGRPRMGHRIGLAAGAPGYPATSFRRRTGSPALAWGVQYFAVGYTLDRLIRWLC